MKFYAKRSSIVDTSKLLFYVTQYQVQYENGVANTTKANRREKSSRVSSLRENRIFHVRVINQLR